MPSVLFVCTGNRYRSPIAAAAFRRALENMTQSDRWAVGSAGTWTVPDLPPVPVAIQAAQELDLDITNDRSRLVNQEELAKHNLILVMEAGQKEAILSEFPGMSGRVFLLPEVATGICYDLPDPLRSENGEADRIATEIVDLIQKGFQKICQLASQIEKAGSGVG